MSLDFSSIRNFSDAEIEQARSEALRQAGRDRDLPCALRPGLETLLLLASDLSRRLMSHPDDASLTRLARKVSNTIKAVKLRDGRVGLVYEDWLAMAHEAAVSVRPPQDREGERCEHHVYVVLTAHSEAEHFRPGLYVGLTGLGPEGRFDRHMAGVQAGRGTVQNHGVCLLPAFFSHLNPLPHDDAKRLEPELANAMRKAVGEEWSAQIHGPKE